MSYPSIRLRRLRQSNVIRNFVAETHLKATDLVWPLFISDQVNARIPIESMPGVFQLSIDNALIEIGQAMEAGIRSVILFGVPEEKDSEATMAWADHGIIQRAIRKIKATFGDDLLVIADTCLCEYMSHGHCGIVMEGRVLNDPSVELIARTAISQANAGADIVAPSDMMDGRVMVIRDCLDGEGFDDIPIMAYSAKYASSFYAPFRDAAASAPSFGDRRSYQMDPRNAREALEEVAHDVEEGADIIMVKPAMAYQDIIRSVRELIDVPLAAYSVSGEYSMIKAASQNGWIDEKSVTLEALTGIKRSGADIILTYHAVEAAQWLKEL